MICPKCNQQLDDGVKFCPFCGEKLEAPAEPVAEEPAVEEAVAPAAEEATEVATEAAPAEESAPAEEAPAPAPVAEDAKAAVAEKINEIKDKVAKKPLIAGGIGAAILAIIIILALVLPSIGGGVNYAMYLKDGEVMITDLPKADGWVITDESFDNVDEDNYDDYSYILNYRITVSEDGKKVFYVEDYNTNDYTFTLYCRNANNEKKEPVKISSDVSQYKITADGKLVTYLTADGDLCQHDLKEKTKIAKDVESFEVTEDGKTFIYTDEDQNIYYKEGKKDEVRVAKEVDQFVHATEDFGTIYYVKNSSLYIKEGKKDAEKLLSDVEDVIGVYETGEIYYVTSEDEDVTLWDFVEDDKAKSDAKAEEPVKPEYPEYPESPEYSDYEDKSEYWDAWDAWEELCDQLDDQYEEDYDAYWDAYSDYEEVADRNYLREELKNTVYGTSKYTLHYFDGKKDTVVTESFSGSWETRSYDAPILVFYEAAKQGDSKIKISEINGTWDVESFLSNGEAKSENFFVAIKANAQEIDVEDKALDFTIAEDGKAIYFLDEGNQKKQTADLYKATISGKKVTEPKLYDSDVYCYISEYGYAYSYIFFMNDDLVYFKDVKDGEGDLVINKKTVDTDVRAGYYLNIDAEAGKIYYYTDWDSKDDYGTLRMYSGKKATTVKDEVTSFAVNPDGSLIYITDYSDKHKVGDLYLQKGKKGVKIDEDVSCIISYSYAGE